MLNRTRSTIFIIILFLRGFSSFPQNINQLQKEYKNAKDDTTRLRLRNEIGEASGIFRIGYWDSIAVDANRLKVKRIEAAALNNLGYLYYNQASIPKALDYYNKSLKVYKEFDDKKGAASLLNNIAVLYENQGDIIEALENYIASLKKYEEAEDKDGMAACLNNLGLLYSRQADITKALICFNRSLKLCEEIGDKKGEGNSMNSIGLIYNNQGDLIKALEYFNNSLKLWVEVNYKSGIATSLMNIATCYKNQKNYSKAFAYYNKSLKICEEIGNKKGTASTLAGLGNNNLEIGNVALALDYFKKSLKIQREIKDMNGIASSLNYIGVAYYRSGNNSSNLSDKQRNYQLSFLYQDSSLKVSRAVGLVDVILRSERGLFKIDSIRGNYLEALGHFEQYIIYRDSVRNEATRKENIRSQFKHEFDKKEAIIKEQQESERKIASEKDRKQQIVIWASAGGSLLLIIFSLFIFRSLQQNKRANKTITLQKELVDVKNHIIEEKQKEIIDSINYAKRIQYSLLAHEDFLKENTSEHFVYFNPKDIVSGDFYWAIKKGSKFYLAVCDSTGHGVPGAFMSLLSIGFLSEAISEKGIVEPNEVFNFVRQRLVNNISKEGQKDGFDGILICIDAKTKQITYSAANNRPILISNNKIVELDADRMPVGMGEKSDSFNLYSINVQKGDALYLYTDGFADQFGGPRGKKFMYKKLNDIVLKNHSRPLEEQKEIFESTFESWRGDLEQVDDVCIIGIRL